MEKIGTEAYPFFAVRMPTGTTGAYIGGSVKRHLPSITPDGWYWMPQTDHVRVAFRNEKDAITFEARISQG